MKPCPQGAKISMDNGPQTHTPNSAVEEGEVRQKKGGGRDPREEARAADRPAGPTAPNTWGSKSVDTTYPTQENLYIEYTSREKPHL